MLRPTPNHGTQRLPNDDDDDNKPTFTMTFARLFATSAHTQARHMKETHLPEMVRKPLLRMSAYIRAEIYAWSINAITRVSA